jgi:hypothetical protein
MSGFVTTTWPALRTADRIGAGVSPSYVAAETDRPAALESSANSATWSESLRRKEEQGSGGRIVRDCLEDRQRVAQRLAGRGGRDDDDVLAAVDGVDRFCLVCVQALDAATRESRPNARIEPGRVRAVGGRPRGNDLMVDDTASDGRLR